MATIDRRPISGSCARCRAALNLASVRSGGSWYCSTACAVGLPSGAARRFSLPERWLTGAPRRFHGRRPPRELRAARHSSD